MKIGEFSRVSHISKETIRYYTSLGLLFPTKVGNAFIYTQRELVDIKLIVSLKSMMFSLKEIQTILSMKKTFYGMEPSFLAEYFEILHQKKTELAETMSSIQHAIKLLEEESSNIDVPTFSVSPSTGVPLSAVHLLACPLCQHPLETKNATILSKYIQTGNLSCPCGYTATIQNGIIVTGNYFSHSDDHPDITRGLYKGLHPDFLKLYQRASDMLTHDLQSMNLETKVVLEANINGYFYLYNNFRNLPKNTIYIVVDKYPEMVAMYKSLIERLNLDYDILYIADAKLEYPIRKNSVDILIDFFGNSEYQFYNKNSYITDVSDYMKDACSAIGAYMNLGSNSQSTKNLSIKYKRSSPNLYSFPQLRMDYEKLGYLISNEVLGSVYETQKQFSFSCHQNGDEMRIYYYQAIRNSRGRCDLAHKSIK